MPDVINWSALKFGLDFVATVALFIYFLYSTFIKKKAQDNSNNIKAVDEKHDARHEELTKKHDALDREVQKLKSSQALLATHEDVSNIKSQLSGLNQKVAAIDHILKVLHDHLLNKKGD